MTRELIKQQPGGGPAEMLLGVDFCTTGLNSLTLRSSSSSTATWFYYCSKDKLERYPKAINPQRSGSTGALLALLIPPPVGGQKASNPSLITGRGITCPTSQPRCCQSSPHPGAPNSSCKNFHLYATLAPAIPHPSESCSYEHIQPV